MDAMERVTWNADEVVGVLGRGEEYVLVPLNDEAPIPDAVMDDAHRRGFKFCGVLCVIEGRAAAKCEPDLEAVGTMVLAAIGFAHQVADKLKHQQRGDGVNWLRRLWTLPDTRN
jgi:hypothetical protein